MLLTVHSGLVSDSGWAGAHGGSFRTHLSESGPTPAPKCLALVPTLPIPSHVSTLFTSSRCCSSPPLEPSRGYHSPVSTRQVPTFHWTRPTELPHAHVDTRGLCCQEPPIGPTATHSTTFCTFASSRMLTSQSLWSTPMAVDWNRTIWSLLGSSGLATLGKLHGVWCMTK